MIVAVPVLPCPVLGTLCCTRDQASRDTGPSMQAASCRPWQSANLCLRTSEVDAVGDVDLASVTCCGAPTVVLYGGLLRTARISCKLHTTQQINSGSNEF